MKGEWKVFGHSEGHLCFGLSIVRLAMGWKRWEVEVGAKLVGQAVEMQLPRHFKPDDGWNPVQILTSLDFDAITRTDGDVEVLADGPQPATNTARAPQHAPQGHGRGFGMIGGDDIG